MPLCATVGPSVCPGCLASAVVPVFRTPSPGEPLTATQPPPTMGHKESKAAQLSSEDIAFLVKNTNRSKKEIKVRPG